mgnify:CR=1 FL=1|tara:strand:- start:245 stop:442 length:198 start_codon:yes stop_codon:yes gene_type:complete
MGIFKKPYPEKLKKELEVLKKRGEKNEEKRKGRIARIKAGTASEKDLKAQKEEDDWIQELKEGGI